MRKLIKRIKQMHKQNSDKRETINRDKMCL